MEVENPLDRSESILRTELLPGLLKAVKFNVDRQAEDVALFEIGHVFALPSPPAVTPEETERVAVIVAPAAGPDARRWHGAGSTTRRRPRRSRPGSTWPTPSDWMGRPWPQPGCRVSHPTRAARAHRPGRAQLWVPSARWTRRGRGLRPAPAARISHPLRGRPPGRTPPALASPRGEPLSCERHRPGLRGPRRRSGPGRPAAPWRPPPARWSNG